MDHLLRAVADKMGAKNQLAVLLHDDFGKGDGLGISPGGTPAAHIVALHLEDLPARLGRRLTHAHARQGRHGIDVGGNAHVVGRKAVALDHVLAHQAAQVCSHGRKLRRGKQRIARHIDGWIRTAAQMFVDGDLCSIMFDAGSVEIESVEIGDPPRAIGDTLADEASSPAGDVCMNDIVVALDLDRLDMHASHDFHADPLAFGMHRGDRISIHTGQQAFGRLQDRDLATRPGEDMREFKCNDAAADEDQALRQLAHFEDVFAGDQIFGTGDRQAPRLRTGGDQDLARLDE